VDVVVVCARIDDWNCLLNNVQVQDKKNSVHVIAQLVCVENISADVAVVWAGP